MPTSHIKTANLGKLKAGLGSVGYSLYDPTGTISVPRSTNGVYELGTLTGIYGANIAFPDSFVGSILWDSGESSPVYATEEIDLTATPAGLASNMASIQATLDADLTFVKDMLGGQWKIDDNQFQMIFYKDDNTTEVARFDLRDNKGDPSFLSVFLRQRVP
jgi:hypothetical protein